MAPPSVLLMLALAAPAASVPNFSTAESSSATRLTEAGTASVRSVIRNAGAGQLEAAGLASVRLAMGDAGVTRQLDAAGLASVRSAMTDSHVSTRQLDAAGLASVRLAMGDAGVTRQLDAAGLASVRSAMTDSHVSTRQLDAAGLASVRTAMDGAHASRTGTRQLDAAGLASVQFAMGGSHASRTGTRQLDGAGLASVMAATKNRSAAASTEGVVRTASFAPRDASAGMTFANGTAPSDRATTVSMRMPAGLAQAASPSPATPTTATVPATGTAPSTAQSQTPGSDVPSDAGRTGATAQSQTDSLSEAGRIAVGASVGALRAAAIAMHGKAAASGLATVGNPDEHYARGVAALQSKDSRTAIAELSACVQAAPSRADCRWELGWAYSVEGRWADSLTQWTQVRALNPNQPDLEGALTQARNQAALQAKLAQPVD
ncbi:tetratricopeptide repeat protein, partial [Corallococcus exercitus]|uniref:tetratricopeptide repeat protein n=1 Tax=Corallococcus exercitus TaxID=2316736 RepID=UPI0034DE8D94